MPHHDIHDVWTVDWPANRAQRLWHFNSEVAVAAFLRGVTDPTTVSSSKVHGVTDARGLADGRDLQDLIA